MQTNHPSNHLVVTLPKIIYARIQVHNTFDITVIFKAELIKAEGRTIRCAIHKLIIAIWNKEKLPEEWKESVIVPIHKEGDKTDCNNYRGISLLPTTYKLCPTSCSQGYPYDTGVFHLNFNTLFM
jgi:hypothetical protein